MKKWKLGALMFLVFMFAVSPSASILQAYDFEGNEEEWLNRCSTAQSSQSGAQACEAFKKYYAGQEKELKKEISSLDRQIDKIGNDIEKLNGALKTQEKLIASINKKIEINEANINKINSEIKILDEKILKLQKSIDERNKIIKDRMKDDQAYIGTNMSLEIVMGAQDLTDMVRKMDGLRRIDEADQKEIKIILEEKEKQDLQKKEQVRLKEEQEKTKEDNVKQKKQAEQVKKQKQELIKKFREQEAALDEKMRSVKVDLSTIQDNIISISSGFDFSGNATLAKPVNGSISAHSFYYPDGSVHLGLDVAVPLLTPIYAPGNGIILYANNPVSTNSGYIGNTTGYPSGTGNSIHMLTQANGTTYALSFFHMAQENFAVRAGQSVKKGQLLGLSGNTGNTTGPHCHLEVINLGKMSIAQAVSQFQATADFSWGNGWGNTGLSGICDVKGAPSREHPEKIYGY